MKITRRPTASLATEHFDTETVALLDAVAVELPDFGPVDLDIAFGTPLDMYEPAGTRREMARYAAAVVACDPALRMQQSVEAGPEIAARRDAARDIVASDPSITARCASAWSTYSSPTPRSCASRDGRPPRHPCRSPPDLLPFGSDSSHRRHLGWRRSKRPDSPTA
ncbi:hypothetical protein ACWDFH_25745 [Streptomyces kronopolitis]